MEFPTPMSPDVPVQEEEKQVQIPMEQGKTGKKFKDFTLDKKQLYTIISDDEFTKVFPQSTLTKNDNSMAVDKLEGNEQSSFVAAAIRGSQKTRTENMAPCFSTSGDPRIDFFMNVLEKTSAENTINLLEKSWNNHPLDTLKLIAQLRSIRDGKGVKRPFHNCLYWLYQNHPKTLYENLEELLKFGYWKDSLQMLMIIAFEGFVHPYLDQDDLGAAAKGRGGRSASKSRGNRRGVKRKANSSKMKKVQMEEKELYNKHIATHYIMDYSKLIGTDQMNQLRLKFAREKFDTDLKYRVFHLKIAKIFAKQLHSDLEEFKSLSSKADKKENTISLAAKWSPSLEGHFDRYTLIASTIAVELIKLIGEPKFEILTKPLPIAVYLSRKTYHKEVCVPLRQFQEIPEIQMSKNQWNKINYSRVPSKCMQRSSKLFQKHDGQRFAEYLKKPEAKVAGGALKPIEILTRVMTEILQRRGNTSEEAVLEKQWDSLVDSIKTKGGGLLKNALAVCDVSGSMDGEPMLAAIGLTLITMDMCESPWDSVCVTFHESPKFHHVPRDSLFNKVKSIRYMEWGMNTNLHKVFEMIVSLGKENKLKQDQMPRILFIFTDMEFDEACRGSPLTNFEAAKKLFSENNYEMPTIVCWNLRGQKQKLTSPCQVNDRGIVLLSGFSGQQLAYVMEQDDLSKMNPLQLVLNVIEKEIFGNLKIFD